MGQTLSMSTDPAARRTRAGQSRTSKRPSSHGKSSPKTTVSGSIRSKAIGKSQSRHTSFASTRLRDDRVSQSHVEPSGKRKSPRKKQSDFLSAVTSNQAHSQSCMMDPEYMLDNPSYPNIKPSQNGRPTAYKASFQSDGFTAIRIAIGLLEKHDFPHSRAAMISGRKEEHLPDLSELSLEDLRSLKACFDSLIDTLRTIHGVIVPHDAGLAKEVHLAYSEAIISRADTDFARRILKSTIRWPEYGPTSTVLVATMQSTLLRIEAVIRTASLFGERSRDSVEDELSNARAGFSSNEAQVNETETLHHAESWNSWEGSLYSQTAVSDENPMPPKSIKKIHTTAAPETTPNVSEPIVKSLPIEFSEVFSPINRSSWVRSTQILEDLKKSGSGEQPSNKEQFTPSTGDRTARNQMPSLEERFAALRKATKGVTMTNEGQEKVVKVVNKPKSQSLEKRIACKIQDISSYLDELQDVSDGVNEVKIGLQVVGSGGYGSAKECTPAPSGNLRTKDPESDAYLRVISEMKYLNSDSDATPDELIQFTVIGPENSPLTQFTWISKTSPNFLKQGFGGRAVIRRHAADRLKADPRSIALFYTAKPSERYELQVQVILDPYIRLHVGRNIYVLDLSTRLISKSRLTIGELRDMASIEINERRSHKIHLFYRSKCLKDKSTMLKDTGLLSERVCQGWEELSIEATVEILQRDCIVCGDEKELHRFPEQITSACDHDVNTCRKCLRTWIKTALDSNGWDKISCPECRVVLLHADIQVHASARQFEKYDNLSIRAALSADPDFRWCLNSSCEAGQIHESNSYNPIFVCHACSHRHCVVHEAEWHEGETCAQYDYRVSGNKKQDEEEASQKTIQMTSKKCPRCPTQIEKNDGCDHMTCRHCSHEFCWVCLAEYGPIRRLGNRMHRVVCTHYRP